MKVAEKHRYLPKYSIKDSLKMTYNPPWTIYSDYLHLYQKSINNKIYFIPLLRINESVNLAQVMSEKTLPLLPVLSVNFIATMGFSIVFPFLVVLTTEFGGDAIAYGIIGATYSFFQFLGAPILGKLSDIYGRRKILLLSQTGTAISWIIIFIALILPITPLFQFNSAYITLPLFILFIGRAFEGISGGNMSVAHAYLADITKLEDRKINFGKMAIAGNIGFLIGPILGGVLSMTFLGEIIPVLTALFISIIAIFLIAYQLPDFTPIQLQSRPTKPGIPKLLDMEMKEAYKMQKGGLTIKDIFSIKRLPITLVIYFFMFLGYNIFYVTLPVYTVNNLNWSPAILGYYYFVMTVVTVIVQGPVLKYIADSISEEFFMVFGMLVLSLSFLLLTTHNNSFVFVNAIILAIGNGFMWPSFLTIISKLGKLNQQGFIQGIASSTGSLASVIGLVFGGIVFEKVGVYSFVLITSIMLFVFLLSLWGYYGKVKN